MGYFLDSWELKIREGRIQVQEPGTAFENWSYVFFEVMVYNDLELDERRGWTAQHICDVEEVVIFRFIVVRLEDKRERAGTISECRALRTIRPRGRTCNWSDSRWGRSMISGSSRSSVSKSLIVYLVMARVMSREDCDRTSWKVEAWKDTLSRSRDVSWFQGIEKEQGEWCRRPGNQLLDWICATYEPLQRWGNCRKAIQAYHWDWPRTLPRQSTQVARIESL